MAPKLLLDEHLSPAIAHLLTALQFDVTCVRDRGLVGRDDWVLLDWCIQEGRAICTTNARHFEREHQRRLAAGQDHFGIITVEQWPTGRLYRALLALLQRTEDIDLLNQLVILTDP